MNFTEGITANMFVNLAILGYMLLKEESAKIFIALSAIFMFEVANSPLKMRTKTNLDSKDKGKDEARKSWASCTNNISANNSYRS